MGPDCPSDVFPEGLRRPSDCPPDCPQTSLRIAQDVPGDLQDGSLLPKGTPERLPDCFLEGLPVGLASLQRQSRSCDPQAPGRDEKSALPEVVMTSEHLDLGTGAR